MNRQTHLLRMRQLSYPHGLMNSEGRRTRIHWRRSSNRFLQVCSDSVSFLYPSSDFFFFDDLCRLTFLFVLIYGRLSYLLGWITLWTVQRLGRRDTQITRDLQRSA